MKIVYVLSLVSVVIFSGCGKKSDVETFIDNETFSCMAESLNHSEKPYSRLSVEKLYIDCVELAIIDAKDIFGERGGRY